MGLLIEKYIGKTGKKLFLLFCWLFTLIVIAAFADMVAGTFNAYETVDGVTKLSAQATVNGAAGSISLLFIAFAVVFGLQKTKDFGYNMIRKHIKVEPARWYTYCDQLGIIVWQDMPSGDRNPQWQNRKYFDGTEMKRSAESEAYYRKEWKEIMDCLYSYPCIGTWVPFNEAWGQFKTVEIAEWTKQYDPTRLVNPASGGNHYTCGDMLDLHNYPAPEMYLYDAQRATVLGEYGGIGLVLKDHIWEPNRNWGYVQFNSSKEATDEYVKYADMLYKMVDRGFSAAVYTQTTDVEVEVNGLMTYDRKVIKLDEKRAKEINTRICNSLKK